MHLVEQYILFKFLHNVKHILNQERDIIIHVILKRNKTRHKIKYFCLFEIFRFFFNKKNLKNKTTKNRTKHVHKQLKKLNQGQVNNTHLSKSNSFHKLQKDQLKQQCHFYSNITVKNSKTLKIIYDNRDQGSTLGIII